MLHRSSRASVSAFVAAALVLVQTRAAWADCANDSECKGDRVCERGTCVSPKAPAPAASLPPAAPPAAVPPAAAGQAPLPPANAAPANAVRVDFEGARGETIRLSGPGASESCRSPCQMRVAPGTYSLHSKTFDERIDVPAHDTTVTMKKGCTACFIVGGILAGSGIPFMAGGWALFKEEEERSYYNGSYYSSYGDEGLSAAGLGMFIGGVIMSVTGVTLLVVGGAAGTSSIAVEGKATPPPAKPNVDYALSQRGVGLTF